MSLGSFNPFGGSLNPRNLGVFDLILPGSSGNFAKFADPLGFFLKPEGPAPPEPLPDPITRDSAAVQKARASTIRSEKKRKGRKSTILTSGEGVKDDQLGIIQRPEARNARLLGG